MTSRAAAIAANIAAGFGLLATSLVVSAVAPAPAAAQNWREITCESWNYREASCPTPGAVRVQLLRVNGGQCIEGSSWIHDRNAIRVRNGCRAVFRIDTNTGWGTGGWDPNMGAGVPNNRWQVVRCESWNYRDQRCPTPNTIRNARLLRVIAGDCRDGETWRWANRAILVRNGCRADFEVLYAANGWGGSGGTGGGNWGGSGGTGGGNWGGSGGNNGGGGGVRTINCESWNFRPSRCPIGGTSSVRLNRVIAGDCREGRTWGWDRNSIWVNGGCRASFNLYS